MYVRLAFAVAAHLEPEILVVDEVLAVGDADFQKKCLGKMKNVVGQGRTVLIVSHNMAAIESLCSRAILLDNGQIAASGAPSDVIGSYYATEQSSRAAVDFPRLGRSIGDSFVRLLGGTVRNRHGDVRSELAIQEPVVVQMRFRILSPRASHTFFPYPGFHFFYHDGNFAFASSPANSDLAELEPGDYVATCFVPPGLLNAGTYYVGFSFADCDKGVATSFYEPSALSFHVTENIDETIDRRNGYVGAISGVVRPMLDWTVVRDGGEPLRAPAIAAAHAVVASS
jgi:lipopolysaccharide transport system ATP-binding protein